MSDGDTPSGRRPKPRRGDPVALLEAVRQRQHRRQVEADLEPPLEPPFEDDVQQLPLALSDADGVDLSPPPDRIVPADVPAVHPPPPEDDFDDFPLAGDLFADLDEEEVDDDVPGPETGSGGALIPQGPPPVEGAAPSPRPVPFPQPWPATHRVAPRCFLRSALFGIVKRGQRKRLERRRLAAWHDVTLTFSGEQLDQFDQDVWMYALELSRHQGGMGVPVAFSAYAFLKGIGRTPKGKDNHERLFESLSRMAACALQVSTEHFDYVGNLVDFYRDRRTDSYLLTVNPKLAVLFCQDLTSIEWRVRQSLRRDLARWLHGYVHSQRATARAPHRIHLEHLRRLCGSDASSREWRRGLRLALEELEQTQIVTLWKLTKDDQVIFVRPSRRAPADPGQFSPSSH